MTREELIEKAWEVFQDTIHIYYPIPIIIDIALEEAARIAEETDTGYFDARTFTAQKIAANIRALKGE